mmetsp:Transcript_16524/g.39204  ORF Transcript_16524/g.39204 Transcript_16524/m.39204 type:complete len:201 (+) Transcript_16524:318-920(+)
MPGKGRRERSTAAAAPTRRRACRRCGRRYRGTSRRRARAGRRRGPPRSCPPSRWPTQAARSGRPGSSARASPRRRRSAATSSRSCAGTARRSRGCGGGRGSTASRSWSTAASPPAARPARGIGWTWGATTATTTAKRRRTACWRRPARANLLCHSSSGRRWRTGRRTWARSGARSTSSSARLPLPLQATGRGERSGWWRS